MFASLAAVLLATAPMQEPNPQTPATSLSDVVIEGRRATEVARSFIADVAAPTQNRGLARWNTPLCVGVANLRQPTAQAIIDRISDIADSLGVRIGAPGCSPNALIIATDDGASLARALVDSRRRAFDAGSRQMTQSDRELEAFQADARPVRWWQISTPTNSETGERAIRLAGDVDASGNPVAPQVNSFASRLSTSIRDDMTRVIIIADIDDIAGLSIQQLSDYFAMLTLVQIAADADTSDYDTVLNLFTDRDAVDGLTAWDMAYMQGLYSSSQRRLNPNQQVGTVAAAIARERREQEPEDAPE